MAASRPNVVLIVADDLGYGEPGCYGGTEIPTPHIDRLAADGVRFTSGYVTASYCAASRAGLLTGRYQTRFGFENNPIGAQNLAAGIGLPVGEKTIADRLRDHGYATALVGKWHLGGTAPFHPQRRGFDEFFGFLHEGHFFVPAPAEGMITWLRRRALPDGSSGRWFSPDQTVIWSTHLGRNEPPYDADNPLLRSSQPVIEPTYLTDAFTREACDFIDRHHEQPFFLCVAYNAVHSPLQAPRDTVARFAAIPDIQRRIFAAMLHHLDVGVGQIRDRLDVHRLREQTLIVFLSDNGGPTRELTSSNAPLRGGKGSLYEGGIRVPFLLAWPGQVKPAVVQQPVISLDLLPTFLAAAEIETTSLNTDGKNLLPALLGETDSNSPRTLYWRMGDKHALREQNWKLVRQRDTWELYHLSDDIAEQHNLIDQCPKRVGQLRAQWETWNAEQAAPLW